MLTCTLSLFALAFGLHAAQLPPADSFRLTMEEVVQSLGCRVIHLKIEARSAEMLDLHWEHGAGGCVGLVPALKGKARREGTVMLASVLGERSLCHTTTMLYGGRSGDSGVVAPLSFDLAPDAKLTSGFSISITNGLYKLDRPLVVGTRNGETMRLVVGSWNWQQASQNK